MMTAPGDRRDRLSAALRENLKRRKAQARRRADDGATGAGEDAADGEDRAGQDADGPTSKG